MNEKKTSNVNSLNLNKREIVEQNKNASSQ